MPYLKYIYLKINLRVFLAGSTVDMITCKSESDNNADWAFFHIMIVELIKSAYNNPSKFTVSKMLESVLRRDTFDSQLREKFQSLRPISTREI